MCAIFVHYTLCFFIGNLSIEFTPTTMTVMAVRHEALVFGVKLSSFFYLGKRNDRNSMRDFHLGNYGLMSPVFSLFSVLCGIITFFYITFTFTFIFFNLILFSVAFNFCFSWLIDLRAILRAQTKEISQIFVMFGIKKKCIQASIFHFARLLE